MQARIRDAVAADAAAIRDIYNHEVARTTVTWNETPVDEAGRAAWIAARQGAGHPVLVAEGPDGEVLGYATYEEFRAFDGYRRTVEHSVYVREDCRGRGLGSALLAELIGRARGLGLHVMVAAVSADNQGSVRLHERLGFTQVGLMPEVGVKFGRWLDLVLLQLVLDPGGAPR
ncbi:GNAT family N-acetyltransferase [Desulfocurvus sp. DL9XJH121]